MTPPGSVAVEIRADTLMPAGPLFPWRGQKTARELLTSLGMCVYNKFDIRLNWIFVYHLQSCPSFQPISGVNPRTLVVFAAEKMF